MCYFSKKKVFASKSEAKKSSGDFIGALLLEKVRAKLSFSLKSVPRVLSRIGRIRDRRIRHFS